MPQDASSRTGRGRKPQRPAAWSRRAMLSEWQDSRAIAQIPAIRGPRRQSESEDGCTQRRETRLARGPIVARVPSLGEPSRWLILRPHPPAAQRRSVACSTAPGGTPEPAPALRPTLPARLIVALRPNSRTPNTRLAADRPRHSICLHRKEGIAKPRPGAVLRFGRT